LRERILVSKRARQKFDLERFDLKKLYDIEVKEKYQVEISNRFAALESLDESFDINNAGESVRKHIKTSAKDNLGQWYSTFFPPVPLETLFTQLCTPKVVGA
jgi:hypothetical protein